MMPVAKLLQIHELLASQACSQREIARRLCVSRTTVAAVARGERPMGLLAEHALFDRDPGPLGRCPSCGGRVYLPCRLCYVRALKYGAALRVAEIPPLLQGRRRRRLLSRDFTKYSVERGHPYANNSPTTRPATSVSR